MALIGHFDRNKYFKISHYMVIYYVILRERTRYLKSLLRTFYEELKRLIVNIFEYGFYVF